MKWKLENLYESVPAWEEDFKKTEKGIEEIRTFEGTLHEFESFKAYYILQKELSKKLNKLYQYASLKSDLDKKNVKNAAKLQRVGNLVDSYKKATAFEAPELIELGRDTVFSYIEKDEALKAFRFPMEKLFHQSDYILDEKSEKLLSHYNRLSKQGSNLHGALSIADNASREVTLKNGERITVTSGNFRSHLADLQDAGDRQKVFEAIFSHYDRHRYTFAQIYDTVLQSDIAKKEARGYPSTLEAYLHGNRIDPKVYHNLLETAEANTHLIKRYYALRKKVLNLKEHRTFDRFLPLAEGTSTFSYEGAKSLFFDAAKELGDDFHEKARDALKDGYVDVYEQDGKQDGAYSSSALDEHPFILLNYDGTLSDVFTVAHEAGHSMHSLYAMENQPIPTQNYPIFVAEVASTFNEHLLLDAFIEENKGTREDRIQLLQQSIDDIIATFFRQTLFAAYELKAHEKAEANEPITHETLSGIMQDLYKSFYDIDIDEEPGKSAVWAFVPHMFFAPYYVYQYATSFAASLALYKEVKKDPANIKRHIDLLKSGGSDFPLDQLADAGVDLKDKKAFNGVIERFEALLDELEVALNA